MSLPRLTVCLTLMVSALSSPLTSLSISSTLDSSSAFLGNTGVNSSAVDSKGVRHRTSDYGGAIPPWLNERIQSFAPDYPYADRAQRREGTGLFRLILDLKTGYVTKIVTLKSTGFTTLDRCAVTSFQRWRWRPGKWKEIDIPIKFTMHDNSSPPKSARLPRRQ